MRRSRATIGVRRSRNYWNWCLSGWKPEVHLESKVLFTRGQGLPEHFRHCVELFSRARLLWHFPRILKGTHCALPEVIQATRPWAKLEGLGGQLPVALD